MAKDLMSFQSPEGHGEAWPTLSDVIHPPSRDMRQAKYTSDHGYVE
jgi:hypothetical protein